MVHNLIRIYDSSEANFSDGGLGTLNNEARSCTVSEELNGEFELELVYPIDGEFSKYVRQYDNIIVAKPNPYDREQPFRIYRVNTTLEGFVTISARHISYDLDSYIVAPFRTSGAGGVSAQITYNTTKPWNAGKHGFYIIASSTEFPSGDAYELVTPCNARSLLGGSDDALVERYGGELRYDRWTVYLEKQRGEDRGVIIEYGKNLTSLEQDSEPTHWTDIYPFYYRTEENEKLYIDLEIATGGSSGRILPLPEYSQNIRKRTYLLDLSNEFDDIPTNEDFLLKVQEKVQELDLNPETPPISLTVSFVTLGDTSNYEDVPYMDEIHLGDTVTVAYKRADDGTPITYVSAKTRCISTSYDVLSAKYTEIQLGEAKSSLSTTIANQGDNTKKKIDDALISERSFYKEAVKQQTEIITGNRGGYVVLQDSDVDGYPDRILVMDALNVGEAKHVWQFNKSGLGYSETGINGDYILGLTMDGHINGRLLTAESVQADEVLTGIIKDKHVNPETGAPEPLNYWNLLTGEFQLRALAGSTVGGKNIASEDYATNQLNGFINGEYATYKQNILLQMDKKAETWYQDDDPSVQWNTPILKNEHNGDMWYCTNIYNTTYYQKTWVWNGSNWQEMTTNPPMEVFNTINGKARIFVSEPFPPYDVGDSWFQGATGDILNCVSPRYAGSFHSTDWAKLNKYVDQSTVQNTIDQWDANTLTQLTIFNKLMGGKPQGIVLDNGSIYISASVIKSGALIIGGNNNMNGTILVQDGGGNQIGSWTNAGIAANGTFTSESKASNGVVTGRTELGAGHLIFSDGSSTSTYFSYLASAGIGSINVSITNNVTWNYRTTASGSSKEIMRLQTIHHGAASVPTLFVYGKLWTKNGVEQQASTVSYGNRILTAASTASPISSDVGSGVLNKNGECYVMINDIFSEFANTSITYYVFLQKEGPGDLWVEEKNAVYFLVKGTPNLAFSWEIKARNIGSESDHLEAVSTIEVSENVRDSVIEYEADLNKIRSGYDTYDEQYEKDLDRMRSDYDLYEDIYSMEYNLLKRGGDTV